MNRKFKGMACLCILVIACQSINAQSFGDILNGAKKVIEKTVTGGTVTKESLIGTWSYSKPAIELKSSNTIANLGAETVNSTLVEKLSKYYGMVGLKQGAFSISFTEDGKISTKVLGKQVSGTYSISEDGKTLNIGYKAEGKTYAAKVSLASNELSIMVGGDKLMSFIQNIADKIPSNTISAMNSLLKNYEGLLVGFTFAKTSGSTTGE